mgnify:FL=1
MDAIIVDKVSKRYRRYHPNRPRTLQEAVLRGLQRLRAEDAFWALDGVSFNIERGKMTGVIGANGAGKSTLLRLIGGVGRPDRGSLEVRGRVGALLDLGVGFHPDLTGRENVFINGVISGLTRREIRQRFDAMVSFAELEAFIDSPLRTYSTGMQMRLAFSVAAHTDPEILLIDEILAVGDIAFQRKCIGRIEQFKANGCTILLVSHDPEGVKRMCDEAIWLRSGKLAAYGPAQTVVELYVEEMRLETQRRTPIYHPPQRTAFGTELIMNENRFGSLEMEIRDVHLSRDGRIPVDELKSGDSLWVEIEYLAPQAINSAFFGVSIHKESGEICLDLSTSSASLGLVPLHGKGKVSLHLERLDLTSGRYLVDVGIYREDWAYAYDYHWNAYPFIVGPAGKEKGMIKPPHHWEGKVED